MREIDLSEAQNVSNDSKLPRPIKDYYRQPLLTLLKILWWLNALWHFRKSCEVGRWTRLEGRAFVSNEGKINIGERVLILSRAARTVIVVKPGAKLEIGARTFINYGCDIGSTELVEIGEDCMIGTQVMILDNHFHRIEDLNSMPESQPVKIGDRVWIGNRSIILPGVSIGDDAVVGAGSVVTRAVPPRTVVVGNPAKIIKEY
ncbi:MAG TPA: DapH/DapD/GlmU-related protein [Chloroflexia bacterium]|nr:DapH/DapD/GlmU-related protein [Chloroflexia bacterium]